MKKKIIFLLFIFFISANNLEASNINSNKSLSKVSKIENVEKNKKEKKYTKINFKNKNILKKQIQKRKKYHKNLLSLYNTNFDEKYLNMITNNGIIINNLRKYYEYKYII